MTETPTGAPTGTLTVVIPAHDEEEFIADAIRSALRQTIRPEQVLVLADACTDRTAEIARSLGASVLEVDFRSKPDALNRALRSVSTEYMAVLDADSYFASDEALDVCLTTMREQGYGGVCMSVTSHSTKGLFQRSRAIEWAAAHRVSRKVESWHGWVAVLSGMAGVYRTSAVLEVGGWSNDGLCEDVELALKMNRAGHHAGFVSGAYVCVRDPESWSVYWRQSHRWAAGWAQAIYKHKSLFFRSWGFTKVFGAMLIDSALLASGYVSLMFHLVTGFQKFDTLRWLGWWFVMMSLASLVAASFQIGIRRAVSCYPAFILVGTFGTAFSLWVMFREWVLGKHLTSWTGRQGRQAVITRMTGLRRLVLATLGIGGGAAVVLAGTVLHRAAMAGAGGLAIGAVAVASLPWHLLKPRTRAA